MLLSFDAVMATKMLIDGKEIIPTERENPR
jgi:hypothetical protein